MEMGIGDWAQSPIPISFGLYKIIKYYILYNLYLYKN